MHVSDCVIFNPVENLWRETENNVQIKHVQDRKKNFIYFLSIVIDSISAKLLTLMNNMTLAHSADSVVYQVKLKPACPATGANQNSEILSLARLAI